MSPDHLSLAIYGLWTLLALSAGVGAIAAVLDTVAWRQPDQWTADDLERFDTVIQRIKEAR